MKKQSRLTALLLALCMLMSTLPVSALADGILTLEDYLSAVQRVQQELSEPSIPVEEENAYTLTRTTATETIVRETVTGELSGEGESAFTLPLAGKLELSTAAAADAYQWQIDVGGVWANIVGDTAAAVTLTYAKVQNALSGGTARVRCAMTQDGQTVYSAVAAVTVDETVKTQTVEGTEEISAVSYTSEAPKSLARTLNAGVATYANEPVYKYYIRVYYQFENGDTAAQTYEAEVSQGSDFPLNLTFPTVTGYLPYVNGARQDSINQTFENIQGSHDIYVTYKPTEVNYTVKHYLQNADDDEYTLDSTVSMQGLTASTVSDVAKTYEGFYALVYEKPAIAADGSTVVEVYYDRYYYLMSFNLDGGYGVEPIYARYGAAITGVGTPTKAGYTFQGWSLDGSTIVDLAETMPAANTVYTAVWGDPQTVNYTVVYWRENANDSNYSFWGQVTRQATAGTFVSGSDDVPTSITNATVDGATVDERPYFTYNGAKTNKNVEVKGDGTTIVNVYYYRNTYHLYFYGISGTCAIEEHTHGDGNCNSYLDCLQEEHVHDENCERILTCSLTEHEHTQDCFTLTCELEEHTEHTAECLICGQEEHQHSDECCTHVHDKSCYRVGSRYYQLVDTTKPDQTLTDLDNGIYTYTTTGLFGTKTHYYLNIGDKWYCAGNGTWTDDTTSITLNCSHTHSDDCCKYELTNHTHTDECYKDTLHTHSLSCYSITCGQAAHVHTDTCYVYSCGAEAHEHDESCYRPCTKLEHTHTNRCDQNSTKNVIYVISAKYEQNIADVWPTADKFTNYTLNGWSIDGVDNMAVSKRVSMTADLCDTSDNLKYAEANSGGSKQTLYYMFESFDQTSPVKGDTRRRLNGTYYDSDSRYYQVVNDGSNNWGQKPIEGMEPTGTVKYESNDAKVFLYYKRNRSSLMYNNSSDGIVKTVSNIMYEQPLVNYRDSDGNLLSAFVPSYPSKLEPGVYEFKGWYTTPECYEGTEFDFSTATMPNGNLTLYACWKPITRTVEFYLDEDALKDGTKLESHPDLTVPHGSFADPTPVDPTNGGYTFVGWFYKDNGVEKAFDFANMPVTKDMKVYGKWSSNTLMPVIVYFKYMDEDGVEHDIAAPVEATPLAGTTVTFDAKGGTDLYAAYQEGYFPVTKSHSMLVDINKPENAGTTADGVEWVAIEKDGKTQIVQSYTFWYKKVAAVPYTVYYVTAEKVEGAKTVVLDGTTYYVVANTKTVSDNRKAVVTEVFEPVPGYMPDAYQKRLVLSVTEEGEPDTANNVIVFYYTKDNEHAYYSIKHYTEDIDNNGNTVWTEYASSQAVGDIGTTYKANPMTIPGFTYDPTVPGTLTEGVLTADAPLELKFYYRLNRTSLTVTKEIKDVVEPNASFVFRITGYGGLDLKVVINGEGSVTIDNLIVGKSYTVEEVSSNWRYQYESGSQTRALEENPAQNAVKITNKRTEDKWLDSNAYSENVFDAVKTGNTENGNEGGEQS